MPLLLWFLWPTKPRNAKLLENRKLKRRCKIYELRFSNKIAIWLKLNYSRRRLFECLFEIDFRNADQLRSTLDDFIWSMLKVKRDGLTKKECFQWICLYRFSDCTSLCSVLSVEYLNKICKYKCDVRALSKILIKYYPE